MQALNPETDIYFLNDHQKFVEHQIQMLATKAWLVHTLSSPQDPAIQAIISSAQTANIFIYFITELTKDAIQKGYTALQEIWTQRQNQQLLLINKQQYHQQLIKQQLNLEQEWQILDREFQLHTQDYQKKLHYLQTWQAAVGDSPNHWTVDNHSETQPLYQLTVEQKQLFKKHIEQEELLNQSLRAIKTKFLLVTENFKIVGTNHSPIQSSSLCYQLLFNRTQPCPGCHLGQPFELKDPYYQVSSAPLKDKKTKLFINWYQTPVARKLNELNITGNTRLTQLGIISASMAHELNNPLAGILSFTQLLIMDKGTPHHWQPDLALIEQATQRTRKLIERLLIFAKHHHQTKHQEFTPQDFIELAYEIAKLDIFKQDYPNLEIQCQGFTSPISSELGNLLLMITELILQKILFKSDATAIRIQAYLKQDLVHLEFQHPWLPSQIELEKMDLLNNLKWALNGQVQQNEADGQKLLSVQFRRPDF